MEIETMNCIKNDKHIFNDNCKNIHIKTSTPMIWGVSFIVFVWYIHPIFRYEVYANIHITP